MEFSRRKEAKKNETKNRINDTDTLSFTHKHQQFSLCISALTLYFLEISIPQTHRRMDETTLKNRNNFSLRFFLFLLLFCLSVPFSLRVCECVSIQLVKKLFYLVFFQLPINEYINTLSNKFVLLLIWLSIRISFCWFSIVEYRNDARTLSIPVQKSQQSNEKNLSSHN